MKIKFKTLTPEAIIPAKAHPSDAGWDLYCSDDVLVEAGGTVVLPTGIAVEIPVGWYGQIKARSSLAAKGLMVGGGVIDSGYRGEVRVVMHSFGRNMLFRQGDKIAQMVFLPVPGVSWAEEDLSDSSRDTGGFGSTGR